MTRWACVVAVGVGALPSGGCMMSMHGMQHGPSQHMGATTIVTEVRNEQLAVTLTVPPLVPGQESVLLIVVRNAVTGEPTDDAHVEANVRRIVTQSADHAHEGTPTAWQAVAVQREAPSAYRATHTFHDPGTHEITVTVHTAGEATGAQRLQVTATQEVRQADHGAARSKALLILGGAAMVVMMVLRWIVL